VTDVPIPDPISVPTTTPTADVPALRRRGPRLPLEFPVLVSFQAENGEQLRKNGETVSVGVNGALLVLRESVAVGQSILLTNAKTDEEIQCTVKSVQQKNDTHHVGVEFATWCPEFWEITFPREPGDPEPPAELPESAKARRRAREKAARQARTETAAAPPEGPPENAEPTALQPKPGAYKKPAIALAALATLAAAIWMAMPNQSSQTAAEPRTNAARVLPAAIAQAIPSPAGFRLATAADFAPQAVSWLQSMDQNVSGQIDGDFAGSGKSRGYVLVRNQKSWRVVILADGQLRCDAQYQAVAFAGRVPRDVVRRITWAEAPSAEPDGDGLLVVRAADKPGSGVVLFLHGSDIVSGTPADYQQIPEIQAR